MTTLSPVRDIPSYAVIIRAIHERGQTQADALAELTRRDLWLATEQRRQAGLSDREGWTIPEYPGASVRALHLRRGAEAGDVRIQYFRQDCYRVATFLPGVHVQLPGDSPKTEPESSQWCDDPSVADGVFNRLVSQAFAARWEVS